MRIDSALLLVGGSVTFGQFNVLVGGNSTGKTTFLTELYCQAAGYPWGRFLWLKENSLNYSSINLSEDIQALLDSAGWMEEGAGRFFLTSSTKNISGDVDFDANLRIQEFEFEAVTKRLKEQRPEELSDLLTQFKYRRPFVSFMNCESRLNMPGSGQLVGYNAPASNVLNVLYRDRVLRERISQATLSQFGLRLVRLNHLGTNIVLGLSKEEPPSFDLDAQNLQSEYRRIEEWKRKNMTEIQQCGHGVRSVLRLLCSFYDPINQVLLIDEPEMHIYPSQKRWLGRQLVELAGQSNKQVFLATHDPMVLQGILDSELKVQVFRFDDDGAGARITKQCELGRRRDVGAKRNQESYLQALFYQRCVGVEGAADRAFYQILTEELVGPAIVNKDLGFVACGGVGQSKHMVELAQRVGLRSAFIYDFDSLLFQTSNLLEIYATRGGRGQALRDLNGFLRGSYGDERDLKAGAGDAPERGMGSAFAISNNSLFQNAINELGDVGVFVVPEGSLESWAPDVQNKARFAEEAPDAILGNDVLKTKLATFLIKVIRFLA